MTDSLRNPPDDVLRELLASTRTIAVIGWSDKEDRPSHETADYLHKQGYRIIPVNPRLAGKSWNDEPIYGCVTEIPERIDLVDVFRRADYTPEHAVKAVEAGASAFWLQLGIRNGEAGRIATEGGLLFIQDRCTHIEHLRLIKGYPFPAPHDL